LSDKKLNYIGNVNQHLVFSIEDLDEFEIRKTLKDLSQYGRGKVFSEKQIVPFLTYYGLYQNDNLTNAAVVLFAKEPTRYLPQCRVRITVFAGSKSSDTFIHDRILEGNLFKNIEEVLQFFDVNIASKSNFSDKKWLREDVTFPKLALREGLMNALIHRDYSNVSGSAIIAFYPDRLEISNYGELPIELKPSDLAKNHLSMPRNPDIAHICFIRQMIEKIGRGTIKMIEDCENKGYPKPKWQSKSGTTTLTFPNVTVTTKTNDAVNDAVNDTVNDAVNDAVKRGIIDTVSDAVNDALNDAVKTIASTDKGVSINEVMQKTGKSNATVKRYLQLLKAINLIEFKGSAKTGKYYITTKAFTKMKKKK
jgi:ATP-dependent DNA helicase RecG